MAEQLLAIENETLRELVRLIATPGTKAITESGGQTRTSVPVRKLWAMLSYETIDANLNERGVNPTVSLLRMAVEGVGKRWPWAGKQGADRQVLMGARKSLKAHEFDSVHVNVGPKTQQPKRTGKSGPSPAYEELEAQMEAWAEEQANKGNQESECPAANSLPPEISADMDAAFAAGNDDCCSDEAGGARPAVRKPPLASTYLRRRLLGSKARGGGSVGQMGQESQHCLVSHQ